jgi:hypothetical protein
MKKILFLLLLAGAVFSASAQTTTTTTRTTTHKYRYYYYPASNIYYDEDSGNYWYWDNASSQWSLVQTLPSNMKVVQTQRYPVMYNGADPWKNNAADIKKFKVKKNGKVKIKPRRY